MELKLVECAWSHTYNAVFLIILYKCEVVICGYGRVMVCFDVILFLLWFFWGKFVFYSTYIRRWRDGWENDSWCWLVMWVISGISFAKQGNKTSNDCVDQREEDWNWRWGVSHPFQLKNDGCLDYGKWSHAHFLRFFHLSSYQIPKLLFFLLVCVGD